MTNPVRRVATIAFAFVMAVASINLTSVANVYASHHNPNGNNGTLKVHEKGTPSGTESNDPKVCVFNFEGFGLDANQTGNVTISGQGGTTLNPPVVVPFSSNASGYGETSYINDGGALTLANGHYKAELDNKFGTDPGNKAKSKVFKVTCDAPTPTSVTPLAPSQVDLCGIVNDTYTIPAQTGVIYQINNQTVGAATYPGTGSVTITALAAQDYVLQGTASWTFTFTNVPCVTTVTPAAPTKIDLCGKANDTYTIPTAAGVTYFVNGVEKVAGTYPASGLVVITASANPGYVLAGTTSWTFLFTNLPCVATPAAPTKLDVCGKQNDTYTIPTTTGVRYFVNGVEKSAGTYNTQVPVLIVAVAKPGYILNIHSQLIWVFTYTNKKCADPCLVVDTVRSINDLAQNDDKAVLGYSFTDRGAQPSDFVNVVCPKAELAVTAVCDPKGVIVTIVNSGNAEGTVYVNGDKVVVAVNTTKDVTVSTPGYKAAVKVTAADMQTVLYEKDFDCTPGRGGTGGGTTVTPIAAMPAAELPTTGVVGFKQLFTMVLLAISTYGLTYFLQGRRKLNENE